MDEPRNAPAYAELLEWMEEAVEYVNKGTRSPSLEAEGRKLLRNAAPPKPAATIDYMGEVEISRRFYMEQTENHQALAYECKIFGQLEIERCIACSCRAVTRR